MGVTRLIRIDGAVNKYLSTCALMSERTAVLLRPMFGGQRISGNVAWSSLKRHLHHVGRLTVHGYRHHNLASPLKRLRQRHIHLIEARDSRLRARE